MKQKWFLPNLFSLILLITVLFAPNIFAQAPAKKENTMKHLQYLQYLYEFLQMYYIDPVDPEILYDGAMAGMLNALKDPYTIYIDNESDEGRGLHDTTTGFFGGIGISFTKPAVSTPEKPAYIEVAHPIEDTPSWRAGIQAGDFITEIEGKPTEDMNQTDVVSKLRGKIGTSVTVTVQRGKNMVFPVTLVRGKIEVPTIKYEKLTKDIGYIRLIGFNPNSYPKVRDALLELTQKGSSRFILDLRNNGGGLLSAAVDTASLFIQDKTVVSTKSRIPQQNIVFKTNPDIKPLFRNTPLVILINKYSASASEILAGALKDYKCAYLIGETSFGKGVVQQIYPLSVTKSFKMTTSRYYTPSDANIDKIGIQPDKEVFLYPQLTSQDERNLEKLFRDEKITLFVQNTTHLTDEKIRKEADRLSKIYSLHTKLVRFLIRQEYNRNQKNSAITDIDYDPQLQEAVKLLQSMSFSALLKKTKTVFENQQAAKKQNDKDKKAS